MSNSIRARKALGQSITAAIVTAMLSLSSPAYAGIGKGGGGGGLIDNDTATAITGNGGSALAAVNVVALNCLLLVPSCGNFGGGNATGGDSGPATAINAS